MSKSYVRRRRWRIRLRYTDMQDKQLRQPCQQCCHCDDWRQLQIRQAQLSLTNRATHLYNFQWRGSLPRNMPLPHVQFDRCNAVGQTVRSYVPYRRNMKCIQDAVRIKESIESTHVCLRKSRIKCTLFISKSSLICFTHYTDNKSCILVSAVNNIKKS